MNTRNSAICAQQSFRVVSHPVYPHTGSLQLDFIPLSEALLTNLMQINNGTREELWEKARSVDHYVIYIFHPRRRSGLTLVEIQLILCQLRRQVVVHVGIVFFFSTRLVRRPLTSILASSSAVTLNVSAQMAVTIIELSFAGGIGLASVSEPAFASQLSYFLIEANAGKNE
jgi:hypothetical protein